MISDLEGMLKSLKISLSEYKKTPRKYRERKSSKVFEVLDESDIALSSAQIAELSRKN